MAEVLHTASPALPASGAAPECGAQTRAQPRGSDRRAILPFGVPESILRRKGATSVIRWLPGSCFPGGSETCPPPVTTDISSGHPYATRQTRALLHPAEPVSPP